MVLTFGTWLPQNPTNASSLSVLRFSLTKVVVSLHCAAFSYGRAKLHFTSMLHNKKRLVWSLKSSADGSGLDPLSDSGDGRTRLLKTIKRLQLRLNDRVQEFRKDLPRKLIFFLVGFYCSTAFSTVIGQTGDWDILSAAVAVAVVEGIGALMYKVSLPSLNVTRRLIVLVNYWKAGLTMGLFLDSFKF